MYYTEIAQKSKLNNHQNDNIKVVEDYLPTCIYYFSHFPIDDSKIQWNTKGSAVSNMRLVDENSTLAIDVSGFYFVYSRIKVKVNKYLGTDGLHVLNPEGADSFEAEYSLLDKPTRYKFFGIPLPKSKIHVFEIIYAGYFEAGQAIFLTLRNKNELYKGNVKFITFMV